MSRRIVLRFLLLVLGHNTSLYAQDSIHSFGLYDVFYFDYDGPYYLLEDGRLGLNLVPTLAGKNIEITSEFRPSRYYIICFYMGAVTSAGKHQRYTNQDEVKTYSIDGNFVKLGIKNQLLNSFFPSRYDIFTGLYYIGSGSVESLTLKDNTRKSYDAYNSFMAAQAGFTYRPVRNILINAGVQYTFLKDRKKYPLAPSASYQPGVGVWHSGGAVQGILSIQYRLPLKLMDEIVCCYDHETRMFKKCWFRYRTPRYL